MIIKNPHLIPAKARAHAWQPQLFHKVSMPVIDVNHLMRNCFFFSI